MNFYLGATFILLRIFYFILYPFLFYVPENQRKSIPPPSDDLLKISATKLSKLIRQKKISSEDVVRAYIQRIKQVNQLINAVVEDRFEDALKEAKSVDDYLRTTSLTENELQKIKPLLGVPVTIKESCMLSGMSFAVGTVIRKGIKADTDGDAVARAKMCGAIPLLVSNTSEMCFGMCCDNYITGTTCNPYDLTRNSGASSGGECALLGAGASLIGIGSDLAGSIRFPAMCCGVFGHKPTSRVVPIKGHFPSPTDKKFPDYLSIGPMTRYAEDLKLLMTVMSGKQAVDLRLHEKVDLSKLRVYFMEECPQSFINPPVHKEIKNAIKESVKYLQKTYMTKTDPKCTFEDDFRDSFELSTSALLQLEGIPNVLKGENQTAAVELAKVLLGQSKFTFSCVFLATVLELKNLIYDREHMEMIEQLKRKMIDELRDDGVLLFPTFPSPALKHHEIYFKITHQTYTQIFNVLGFPATNIPCGKSSDGLPLGIQVIASPNQDRLCFAVAEELENCFGGWIPPDNSK